MKENSEDADENITQIKDAQQYSRITSNSTSDFQKQIIKLGLINKINERLLATQQGVINNLESATRTSFDSELKIQRNI